jgi:hypothetical protein
VVVSEHPVAKVLARLILGLQILKETFHLPLVVGKKHSNMHSCPGVAKQVHFVDAAHLLDSPDHGCLDSQADREHYREHYLGNLGLQNCRMSC